MSFAHNFAVSLHNQAVQDSDSDSDSDVAYISRCSHCNGNWRNYYSNQFPNNNNNQFQPNSTMYQTSSSSSIINPEITQSNIDQTKGLHQESDSNYDSSIVESSTLKKNQQ